MAFLEKRKPQFWKIRKKEAELRKRVLEMMEKETEEKKNMNTGGIAWRSLSFGCSNRGKSAIWR